MTDFPAETALTPHPDGRGDPGRDSASADTPGADDSVGAAFSRLYEDARAYASAEAERQKLRVAIVATGVRNAVLLAAVALMLLFAAIVALLVGCIQALVPVIGPALATLVVVGGGIVVAALLLLLALRSIRAMKQAIAP